MKVRHGTLTGTVKDGAGFYWAIDGTREGLVGLSSVHLGVSRGKAVQIWPAAGQKRATALLLQLDAGLADLLDRYRMSTLDFSEGSGYLRVKLGERVWRYDVNRSDVKWDPVSSSVVFLNNSGPFADAVLPGDYVELEAGMNGWVQHFKHESEEPERVADLAPVSTCDVYLGGFWKNGTAGLAGVQDATEKWVGKARAGSKKSGKGGKGGRKHYNEEKTLKGLSGGPFSVWMAGAKDSSKVEITYPAGKVGITAKVLKIVI